MQDNYFIALNQIDVSSKTEKKNGLTYLSWAWAWGELKKRHPDATYAVYKTPEGCLYHTDGRTCWVETGVTVCGVEHIEYLPVMDARNRSLPLEQVTSFDVNKAIQRSLTKAAARHGLGLYIYAGEDLPEAEPVKCQACGSVITPVKKRDGSLWTPQDMAEYSTRRWGKALCRDCMARSAEAAAPPGTCAPRASDDRQGGQRARQPGAEGDDSRQAPVGEGRQPSALRAHYTSGTAGEGPASLAGTFQGLSADGQ